MLRLEFDFEDFQQQSYPWFEKNFGPIERTKSGVKYQHQPLLGIVEELGELVEAINLAENDDEEEGQEAIVDAIGDVMVYMCDYCRVMGWSIAELEPDICRIDYATDTLAIFAGKLCHSHLKMEQGIRGTTEDHTESIKHMLSGLIITMVNICWDNNLDFDVVVSNTWDEVSKRDWKKNKQDGINE